MQLLSPELLRKLKLPTKEIPVAEWDATAYLLRLSSADRVKISDAAKKGNHPSFEAYLLAKCLVNQDGTPLFTEKDIALLADQDGVVIGRLAKEALVWNGISEEANEEAEKNSETTQSDYS